jgi:hypothetical protein
MKIPYIYNNINYFTIVTILGHCNLRVTRCKCAKPNNQIRPENA